MDRMRTKDRKRHCSQLVSQKALEETDAASSYPKRHWRRQMQPFDSLTTMLIVQQLCMVYTVTVAVTVAVTVTVHAAINRMYYIYII